VRCIHCDAFQNQLVSQTFSTLSLSFQTASQRLKTSKKVCSKQSSTANSSMYFLKRTQLRSSPELRERWH
jgi:hypothetical protein